MSKMLDAISILKGEFRGGDAEELQRKREEKREELEATGELGELDKAAAGTEGGEFRGGDPEELQRKREEKREEMEASGEKELQDEEAALAVEAAGGEAAMAEEAASAAEDEAEKSAGPFAAFEVSPVDTLEDYRPRNWNGDPLDTQPNFPPKRIEPAPVRDEKTRHLPWSEVIGFKVPKEGAPWAYLRRFVAAGQEDKIPEESAKILKAFDAAEPAFFELYDNLNRDVTFDPNYRIHKGGYEEGSIVPGHQYIYRWKDKGGKWQYKYSEGVHPDHHGVEATGISGGHTIEAHPDWHGKDVSTGQDPQLEDPEAAFHFTRQKSLEEGGRHRMWIKNRDKWNPELGAPGKDGKPVGDYEKEAYVLHIPGVATKGRSKGKLQTRGALQLFKDPTNGEADPADVDLKGQKPSKKWPGWDQLEEHVRRQHVNTIFDIHGKPFVQWYESKSRAKPGKMETTRPRGEETKGEKDKPLRKQRGRIRMRYMPDSQFSREVQRKEGTLPGSRSIKVGEFHQAKENIEALQRWARKEKEAQAKEVGLVKPKRLEPLPSIQLEGGLEVNHRRMTNKLEQGKFPRKRVEVSYMAPSSDPGMPSLMPSQRRQGTRKTWRIQWTDGKENKDTVNRLVAEMNQLSLAAGGHLIENIINPKREQASPHMPLVKWGVRDDVVNALTDQTLHKVVRDAVHSFDPDRGVRFSSYVFPKMIGAQYGIVKDVLAEAEGAAREKRKEAYSERAGSGTERELASQWQAEQAAEDEFAPGSGEDQARSEAVREAAGLAEGAPTLSPKAAVHYISSTDKALERTKNSLSGMMQQDPAFHEFYSGKVDALTAAQQDLRELAQGVHSGDKSADDLYRWYGNWSKPQHDLADKDNPVIHDPAKLYSGTYEHINQKQEDKHQTAASEVDTQGQLEQKYHPDFLSQHPMNFSWVKFNAPVMSRVREGKIQTMGQLIQSLQAHKLSTEGHYAFQAQWDRDLAHETGVQKAQDPGQLGFPQAADQAQQLDQEENPPDATYMDRVGEPGAYQYRYDAGGNIVAGTNAPVDHEHHNPAMGEPTVHAGEPTPETHPNLFDEQRRKLHTPVPDDALDVEDNPNYDPDKSKGNHWAKRYRDAKTGSRRHVYLHRDQVTDPKMHRNNAARYVDSQLPKIRAHYHQRLLSDQPTDRAVGLFLALLDQAKLPAQFLQNLEVEDVAINNNVVTFQLGSAQNRSVLDNVALNTLKELLEEKEANDKVFVVNARGLDLITLNRFLHNQFGVLPSGIEVYNNTELFSREFQKLTQQKDTEFTVRHLRELRQQAAKNVAKMTGTDPHYVERNVDPIAVEALFLAASANRHRIGKSKGWCAICSEPMGHCPHSKKKDKLQKGYTLQGRTEFQGLPISIENKKGSVRKWFDPHAKREGKTKMHYDYGYIRGTMGVDKDHVDVYLGPNSDATTAFVVHQMKAPDFTKFDEDKVMLGWDSEKEAKAAYLKQYDSPGFFGSISSIPMEKFKAKVLATKTKPQMIKSHTWQVASDKPERTAEEELFSQWLHDYPLHEHHVHWNALARQTHQDEKDLARIDPPGVTHLPESLEAHEADQTPQVEAQ